MKKEVFLTLLRDKIPDHLKGKPLDIVSSIIKKAASNEFDFSSLSDYISIMGSIKAGQSAGQSQDLFSELSTHDILSSEFLIEKIASWVKKVRRKLFDSTEPPFDWDQAVKWIEKEYNKHPGYGENRKKILNTIKNISLEASKYNLIISTKSPVLPYVIKGDEWEHNVPAVGPKLSYLEYETKRMSKATGFSQKALVLHVLAGIKSIVSRVSITSTLNFCKLSEIESLSNQAVTLIIRARDFRFRELLKIYRSVRKELSAVKSTPLKEKHRRIYRLIRELGEPPEQGEPGYYKFWKDAAEEWNKKYRDDKYGYTQNRINWQAIARAYKKIITELNKTYISKAK